MRDPPTAASAGADELRELPGGLLPERELPRRVAGGVLCLVVARDEDGVRVAVEALWILEEVEEPVEAVVVFEEPSRKHVVARRHHALVGAVNRPRRRP